jgi:hypothetical protein
MKTRHSVRTLTTVLAFALLALLGSGTALAVPGTDGGSGVAPRPTCATPRQLHLGHQQQIDREAAPNLCHSSGSVPIFPPNVPAPAQPASASAARGVLLLGFVALLAGLVASGAWRRLRRTSPHDET